ncbi:MAG: hypothetical protein ABSH44_17140 [Bryobacteraceae bacterium]|jgi:hypothetical protein
MTLHKGQRLIIHGDAGTCQGEVLHAEEPATLPSISGAPEVERVRAALAELGITELALIGHKHDGRDVCFIALENGAGQWRDTHGHKLAITPIHGEWEIKDPPCEDNPAQ